MSSLKKNIQEKEKENKSEFENFAQRSKDDSFLSNLKIMRMRFYQYKEILKLYAINFRDEKFSGTRNSMYAFLILPSVTSLTFNLVSPFSIFRSIAIFGAFGGCFISFFFNMKDEMSVLAMKDHSILGDKVRYRYQQLAAYDNLQMSYKEQSQKFQTNEK